MSEAGYSRFFHAIFILLIPAVFCLFCSETAISFEQVDQSNLPEWAGGWTHINPDPNGQAIMWQTFTPEQPSITAVGIDIMTANPGQNGDTLTVEISKEGQILASVERNVEHGFDGLLRFEFAEAVAVVPGELYELKVYDTGLTRFGWRYASNTYDAGSRYVSASERAGSDWFFQTYSAVQPRIIYVDDDAAGANDGSSWENAYLYLQDALVDANSTEKPVEILIAQGVYKPDQGANQTAGDREATFQLISGVSLKGGWGRLVVSGVYSRNIEFYETILSGDLAVNDVEVADPCNLLNEPTRSENSYHVVTGSETDSTAFLDGFTITGGNADDKPVDSYGSGGGIRNKAGEPMIINCMFFGNSGVYAGGMDNDHCSPTVVNCTFRMNAAGFGGGMGNLYASSIVTNCKFICNYAMSGAGIDNVASDPKIKNCTFYGNSSTLDAGAISNLGSNPVVTNCILWLNSSPQIFGNATISYTNIQGGWPGDGNIDVDPEFVRAGYWTEPSPRSPNSSVWIEGDYHLKSEAGRWDPVSESWVIDNVTSPCIDASDPNSPVGDEPEPNGSRINMGAYGGTAEASKSPAFSWFFETTQGPVEAKGLGIVLPHEHIFTDLRGPTTAGYGQADAADVVRVMAPLLTDAREKGVGILIECSSIGVGRNVAIINQVAEASSLPVVVPTGVYGRANFTPPEHRNMTEDELATLFISEILDGIEGTGIKAGFIKIATDNSPMNALIEKILRAAGRAASETGAAIASHTPTGSNAVRQLDILESIDPAIRFIWVHAQNESNRSLHLQLAARGAYIEFDSLGWNPSQDSTYITAIKELLAAGHSDRILLSHDAGWYRPGETNGGTQKPYTYLIDTFIPKLKDAGVDDATIRMITQTNPVRAFGFKSDK